MKKIEKILKYIDNERDIVSDFEKRSGLSNGYLNNTLSRGADLSKKIEKRIKENNPEDYYKIFPEEKDADYETTQANEKDPPSYLTRRFNEKNSVTQEPFMVPMVPVKAQAGYVRSYDQQTYIDTLEKYALPPGVNPRGAIWRYWEIEGDSMEPAFRNGDIILTSQVHQFDWENLRNFYLYVIVTDDKVCFKRIFCKNDLEWVLISENEDAYEQLLLPVEFVKEVWVYRRSIVSKAPPTKRFEIKV